MKAIDLFNSITDLPEKTVEAAERHRFIKSRQWVRYAAIAAALALVIGLGGMLARQSKAPIHGSNPHEGISSGGGGGENGYSYMAYFGPVMPLTAISGAENVTAERRVDYDFSPYKEQLSQAIVTDFYTLRNITDRDVTLSLLYPAALNIGSVAMGQFPHITVDGKEQNAVFYAGPCTGNLENYVDEKTNPFVEKAHLDADEASWEAYVAHLSDGTYQAAAFAPAPNLNVPVTVYKVDDYVLGPDYDGECPSLQISFAMDYEKTAVMTYGVEGGTIDRENGIRGCARGSLDRDENAFPREPMYIVLYGDDIESYTLQGYQNMGCEPGQETDITATVTRYETTMDVFLHQIVDEYLADRQNDYLRDNDMLSRDFLYRLADELLIQYGFLSTDDHDDDTLGGSLEEVFQAYDKTRVLYFAFDVTIPAGESVDITATMPKEGNENFVGEQLNTNGYDLATHLGSTLSFTKQQASVSHTETVVMLENNFGFDQKTGVTTVTLDPAEEHYWMNVARR